MLRGLELYCGIGGFAAAMRGRVEVVAALDASSHAIQVYNANHDSVAKQVNLMAVSAESLARHEADIWWMSPPCAPYTRRGNHEDVLDRRAASFLHLLPIVSEVRPRYLALENVEGFADSRGRALLLEALDGYEVDERILCPTLLGVPNKRPRYYLVAARDSLVPAVETAARPLAAWEEYLEELSSPSVVPPEVANRYGDGFHVMDASETYTTCFTGSYGKSWNYTGSYLPTPDGLRRFTPREILNFLGFPPEFDMPGALTLKQQYKYIGNSLSLPAVREVLSRIPGLETQKAEA